MGENSARDYHKDTKVGFGLRTKKRGKGLSQMEKTQGSRIGGNPLAASTGLVRPRAALVLRADEFLVHPPQ